MKRALFFTAYDRPEYLMQVLGSWSKVRGIDDGWHVVARIEPGQYSDLIASMFLSFFRSSWIQDYEIIINEKLLGVLHHPWVGFEALFKDYDFVVRAEDDLLVSPDILEYFEWASERYEFDPEIASVHGFSVDSGGSPEVTHRLVRCHPWIWGTWRDRWVEVIGPTWDHDYSTNNGIPGVEAGWDHNLHHRIYPRLGLKGIYPELSRVLNIGLVGTHATGSNPDVTTSFLETAPPVDYVERYVSGKKPASAH